MTYKKLVYSKPLKNSSIEVDLHYDYGENPKMVMIGVLDKNADRKDGQFLALEWDEVKAVQEILNSREFNEREEFF